MLGKRPALSRGGYPLRYETGAKHVAIKTFDLW